ncbi:MAG: HAD family hydrolase [Clostridiales Family XIII bacterium]|jgi:phosphoglycolate phosphatase-like HAD superfamily hydrolase|nr:HAD family hydrolase [Clostridiales Family XIII bacterium]
MLIFWDIDGTLMHCGADGTRALNRAFFELFGIEDALVGVRVGSMMDTALIEKVFSKFDLDPTKKPMLSHLFAKHLEEILSENAQKHILPGVIELLKWASDSGHTNALLTSNLRVGAERKLTAVDLYNDANGCPIFVGGGFGDTHAEKWQAAEVAREEISETLEKAFEPSDVMVIGDGVYDIETARRCGYFSVAVATGWTPYESLEAENPNLLFHNLQDTERVVKCFHETINAANPGL